MSANDANLDKVKNLESAGEKPDDILDAPKNKVEYDSAKIKKQDQAKMFTKVKGAEKRAREAAREEAAEKRADERLKNAEAAAARREQKEAALIAAAKADAKKAQENAGRRKLIRAIILGLTGIAVIVGGVFLAKTIAYRNTDEYSDAEFDKATAYFQEYAEDMAQRLKSGENKDQLMDEFEKEYSSRKPEWRLAGSIMYIQFRNGYIGRYDIDDETSLSLEKDARTKYQKDAVFELRCQLYYAYDIDKYYDECTQRLDGGE